MRTRVIGGCMAMLVAVAACSGSDSGSPASLPIEEPSVTSEEVFTPSDTSGDEMRPVPTVAPTTVEGQVDEAVDGVVDAVPTLVPLPPEPVDPDLPATSAAPPSTDLIGDPQPSPNSTNAPSPTTEVPSESAPPAPDACVRLAAFGVEEIITDITSAEASSVSVADDVCRIASGPAVVEVAFVDAAAVRDDWYLRAGVQPVGDVSEDAVGFSTYMTPAGETGAGFTIASLGAGRGVIVSVLAPNGARAIAAGVTVFAQQAG